MNLRFYIDPDSGDPHIYGHDVNEDEVAEVLSNAVEDRPGREGARVAVGRTAGGRFLRVIYVPDLRPGNAFVITAYDLRGKALLAFRRRRRHKRTR
jgi:hypothetical protein